MSTRSTPAPGRAPHAGEVEVLRSREPLLFRALNAVLATSERIRPSASALNADALEEAAKRATGLRDLGNPYFREGLTRLLDSAERDAKLNPYGRFLLRRLCLEALESRLHFANAQQKNPELFSVPLLPPLIVIGLPRTGTTHLHRLLAADPAHRAVPFWELSNPIPEGADDTPARRRRRAHEHLLPRQWFTPELDAVHYIRVDTPEECMFMLGLTFESLLYWVLAPVYSYLEWYLGQDRREKYREYAQLLRVLQTADPGRRLVLKAPAHTDALDALLEAVPNAMIVQTHRDMVATATSWCSLNYATQKVATRSPDLERSVRANVQLLERALERNLAAREMYPDRVLDVRYDELVAAPMRLVERIYERFGLEVAADYRREAERYLAENPQGKHGKHRYAPQAFGLDPEELRTRFRSYTRRFLEA